MYKKVLILSMLILAALTAGAQWYWPVYPWYMNNLDTAKTNVHLSVGSSVAAGFGNTEAISWAAPSFSYRATDKLTIRGGFTVAGSLLPNGYALHGLSPRSLAPVKNGTQLGGVWAQAEYRVNDNLLIWATAARMNGFVQPLWANSSMPVDVSSLSGGFAYRFEQGSILSMHFRFVHDSYGYMLHPPYGHPYYGPLTPEFELYSGSWPF